MLELAQKVKGGDSPQHTLGGAFKLMQEGTYPMKHMTIKTRDGKVYEGDMDVHPGHPKAMFSWEEMGERFRMQTKGVLSPEKCEKAIQALMDLEKCEDIATLSDLFHR